MRALLDLLRCPKKYELGRIILDEQTRKRKIFCEVLELLMKNIMNREKWEKISEIVESFLQSSYQEDWFDLHWQKKQAIQAKLYQLKCLYFWLLENALGEISIAQVIEIEVEENCNGYLVDKIQVKVDLIVDKGKDGILGLILAEETQRTYNQNESDYMLRWICLLKGLQQTFPNRKIEAKIIDIQILDEMLLQENVIEFTGKEGLKESETGISKAIGEVIKKSKINCRYCTFEEICKASERSCLLEENNVRQGEHKGLEYTVNQKEAISYKGGPMRVCAGPGAGKTEILVARIAHLIMEGISPSKILAITFTRRAVKEIVGRLEMEKLPMVSTIHALAFRIVHRCEHLIGKKRLVNRVDCMQMLLQVLNQAPIIRNANYENLESPNGLLSLLQKDFAFINEHGVEKFKNIYPDKDILNIQYVKDMYERKFQSQGYIRYDDQVRLAVRMLEEDVNIRNKVQEEFEHILLDEVQDIDATQARFIKLLVKSPRNNIVIYGDADQAIYGFRGGTNKFMLDFINIFPEAQDIQLYHNFRSSEEIVKLTNQLICHNNDRISIQMQSQTKIGIEPMLVKGFRANKIGAFIHDLLKQGYRQSDIAIIARSNKELESMCIMLQRYNEVHPEATVLKFMKPKYYLYQDSTFQMILDLVSIYLGIYEDDRIWYRLLNSLGIAPEKVDVEKNLYKDYLGQDVIFPFEGEEETKYLTISIDSDNLTILQAFAKIYRASKLFMLPVREAVPRLVEFFCKQVVGTEEVVDLLNDILRERAINDPLDLWKYLTAAKRFHDDTRMKSYESQEELLHLVTAHDSKGKEFSVVILYGIDDFEQDNVQEGRRLLYVALTRAKERVFITEICKGKSMFLKEISKNLQEMKGDAYA